LCNITALIVEEEAGVVTGVAMSKEASFSLCFTCLLNRACLFFLNTNWRDFFSLVLIEGVEAYCNL
jgi:hypothetical protein